MKVMGPAEFLPIVFRTVFEKPIGKTGDLLFVRQGFQNPLDYEMTESFKKDIRDMLRHEGFKPTGRNKPASEYLRKALSEMWLSPAKGINAAVDICNVVSLHSGLPISVIDAQKTTGLLKISHLPEKTIYVFNPSGQSLKGGGLLALCDGVGPSATPIKDSQRTKTDTTTTETISIIWGHRDHTDRMEYALSRQHDLLAKINARISIIHGFD